MATILGIISIVSMGIVVYLTYLKQGVAQPGYGVTGLFAAIFSLIGLGLGVVTTRNKNFYPIFPWLGVILNAVSLLGIGLLLYWGSRI